MLDENTWEVISMEGSSHIPVFKTHYQNQDSSLQPFDEITKQGKKKMLIFFLNHANKQIFYIVIETRHLLVTQN